MINEYEKIKQKVELLYEQLEMVKMQYELWQGEFTIEETLQYAEIIIVVEDAIITSLIIKIAKIMDIDKGNDSINIFYAFNAIKSCKFLNKGNKELLKYIEQKENMLKSKEILKKIKEMRDKYQAHLDKSYINLEKDEIEITERETLEEIQLLMNDVMDILKYLLKEVFSEKFDLTGFEQNLRTQREKFEKYIKKKI